ncbi:MAG: hypothetical protein BalsKO_29350 [Balneolaceae bacterium]
MNKILLLLFLTTLSVNTKAQDSPEKIIDLFATNLSEGSADTAVTQLFNTNPWMSRNLDAREQVTRSLENTLPLIGNYIDKELITKKKVGESLVFYSFLFKYERQPIRFNFVFYKPEKNWLVYRFNYDDSFDDELIEAGTLYFLDLDQ